MKWKDKTKLPLKVDPVLKYYTWGPEDCVSQDPGAAAGEDRYPWSGLGKLGTESELGMRAGGKVWRLSQKSKLKSETSNCESGWKAESRVVTSSLAAQGWWVCADGRGRRNGRTHLAWAPYVRSILWVHGCTNHLGMASHRRGGGD